MPRILIKPGQLITLYLETEDPPQLLVRDIGDHLVFVFLNRKTRKLLVASCPPGMQNNVIYFLLHTGVLEKMNPADYVVWLAGGAKTSGELIKGYADFLEDEGVEFTALKNHHNLLIVQDGPASISPQDASPAMDFTDFAQENAKAIRDCLLTYTTLTDGENMKEASRQSLMDAFSPEHEVHDAPASPIDFDEIDATMAEFDAMFKTYDPRDKRATVAERKDGKQKADKLISAISQQVSYPEVYVVRAWQTAVIFMGNGRKVKGQLQQGQAAFLLCDEATRMLAICILGDEADAELVDATLVRCWTSILTAAQQASDKTKDRKLAGAIVHQIVSPASSPVATLLKRSVAGQLDAHKARLKERTVRDGKFGTSPASPQYCPYAMFLAQADDHKFSILDFSKPASLGDACRARAHNLTRKQALELKTMDDQDPLKLTLRDLKSIVETTLMVDVASNLMVEFDLSRMQCTIELREKTIVMGSFCEHTQKLALLQIDTDDFSKFFVSDHLTKGHFMALNFFMNSPEKIGAAPAQCFLYCRKPSLGHKRDSDACDAYIKIFGASYDAFYENAKAIYTKREGSKFNLHPMGKPVKHIYNEPVGFLCFSPKDGKCMIELKADKQPPAVKGVPWVGKPHGSPGEIKAFYVALGIKAMDNFRMSEPWSAAPRTEAKPNVALTPPGGGPKK